MIANEFVEMCKEFRMEVARRGGILLDVNIVRSVYDNNPNVRFSMTAVFYNDGSSQDEPDDPIIVKVV